MHFCSVGFILLHLYLFHPGRQADGAVSDCNSADAYGRRDISKAKPGLALKASTVILLAQVGHMAKTESSGW